METGTDGSESGGGPTHIASSSDIIEPDIRPGGWRSRRGERLDIGAADPLVEPKKNRDGQMGKAVRRDLRLFYDVPMHPRGKDLYELAINSDSAPLSHPAWRVPTVRLGSDPAMLFQPAADRWDETHASEWVQRRLGQLVKVLPDRDGSSPEPVAMVSRLFSDIRRDITP